MTTLTAMPKYESYRWSGNDFFGDIPTDWNTVPLCKIAQLKSITNKANEQLLSVYLDKGVIRFDDVEEKRTNVTSLDLSKYQLVEKGDFVLNNQQAWRGSVGVSEYMGIVSPAYLVLGLSPELNSIFANYLFRDGSMVSQYLVCSKGVGTIQRNLYWPHLRRTIVALPSLSEQTAIANFLDEKTTKIDEAIAIKEKQIELLKERKQIIIQQAVTQGLDPTVPMKDSGVEWIGKIPAHWEIMVMKNVINDVGDVDHYMPQSIDMGIPYLMTGDLKEFVSNINFENCKQVSYRDYLRLSKKIKTTKGDVILARYATIGTAAYVDIENEFLVSYSCVTIKPNVEKMLGLYLFQYFKSQSFLQEINDKVNTNTQGNVGISDLRKVKIPLPTIKEQLEIIEFIKDKINKADGLIALQSFQIEKLKEYKSTLINSAVTGKIKVV